MYINKMKLDIAMADAQLSARGIKSISQATYHRMILGKAVKPATIGRLAKELGVNAADIAETEKRG